MNETTNEVMENNEVTEMMVGEPAESGISAQTNEENETSGKGMRLLLAGVGLAVAGGIAAAKKIKDKKNGKPKKKKGHIAIILRQKLSLQKLLQAPLREMELPDMQTTDQVM